ncbi:NAD(P)/FAD-dependent oxidoreductase [Methylopila sp. Yamaguchi]|uniref:NAD(P)/FAD-dependent oxidoreductase n=1 Tax=Methylopila sp. Yamaguchi TaxID=1437817 RepID=UPI000CC2092C|nr:FAD-binding oxidoreductase [Methylopila sp. Yamaguchi]GBD48735.1 FAD dependent oxidoreductase [Methylopila sp. Yamaguchi]
MRDHLLEDDAASLPSVYADDGERPDAILHRPLPRMADVAIVGAGLTGLAAALHLAEHGASVVVLDANDVGTGGTGRSFGQVVPYLKLEPAHAERHFGPEIGGRLIAAAGDGPDYVYGLIETYQIACEAVRNGLLFAAHTPEGAERLAGRAAYWRARGAAVELLDRAGTAAAVGGGSYPGALLDRRGGTLNPLALARGLARAAANAGASIVVRALVRSVTQRGGGWEVATTQGATVAKTVLVCTNAYRNGLAGQAGDCVQPIRVHQAVSKALPAELAARVLPGRQALTDTRRLPSGLRVTRSGRLIATVEGPTFGHGSGGATGYASERIARLFPFLPPISWDARWSGWIDMALDQYPRIYESAPGLYAGLGLSGRGLALGPMLGRDLARKALGANADDLAFPVSNPRDHRWFRGAKVAIKGEVWKRKLYDRLDEWRHQGRDERAAA